MGQKNKPTPKVSKAVQPESSEITGFMPDNTHEEAGMEQYDRVQASPEPAISYGADGKRLHANDIGLERTEAEDDAMNSAMIAARGNRRDQQTDSIASGDVTQTFNKK